jgi:hypothetical protein
MEVMDFRTRAAECFNALNVDHPNLNHNKPNDDSQRVAPHYRSYYHFLSYQKEITIQPNFNLKPHKLRQITIVPRLAHSHGCSATDWIAAFSMNAKKSARQITSTDQLW